MSLVRNPIINWHLPLKHSINELPIEMNIVDETQKQDTIS